MGKEPSSWPLPHPGNPLFLHPFSPFQKKEKGCRNRGLSEWGGGGRWEGKGQERGGEGEGEERGCKE